MGEGVEKLYSAWGCICSRVFVKGGLCSTDPSFTLLSVQDKPYVFQSVLVVLFLQSQLLVWVSISLLTSVRSLQVPF